MDAKPHVQEFVPEKLSRRGELNGWSLTLLLTVGWWLLKVNGVQVAFMTGLLLILVFVFSLTISLSNWVDRKTRIRVDLEGVTFENGLRRVRIAWMEIAQVTVTPGMWNAKRVVVNSEKQSFSFHTLGTLQYKGETRGHTGFMHGELILQRILKESGLEMTPEIISDVYYYRK